MAGLIYFYVFISLCVHGDAIRCFDCQGVPYPRDCSRVRECDPDEYCFTEQVVTTGGNVVYNSGCLSKLRCSTVGFSLIGKRSEGVLKRTTDLVTCMECCADSFCNKNGCGVKEISLEQRGPYCFNCDAVLDPKSCEKVAVCMQNEVCTLHTAVEFQGLPETVYRSQCGKQSACDEVTSFLGINNCKVKCCNTDFCNDNCDTLQNTSTTTVSTQKPLSSTVSSIASKITNTVTDSKEKPLSSSIQSVTPQVSESTSRSNTPSTTKAPTRCRDHDGYMHVEDYHTHLCVHIIIHRENWDDARSACKKEGGDLVVLDTHEKALLLRHTIDKDPVYKEHGGYWIGARDFSNNEHYSWVNYNPVNESETDWASTEPDTDYQDCIMMAKRQSFQWNNKECFQNRSYICEAAENPLSSTAPNVASQITESTSRSDTPSTTKAPTHCRDHDGYMHVEDYHTHLCVHIVIHHESWDGARSACKNEGGDLVVLDTHEKALLLRHTIDKDPVYKEHSGYWIGARDFSNNEHYSWVNYNPVNESETDWASTEPDTDYQDCIMMIKGQSFQWNNKECFQTRSYICEV